MLERVENVPPKNVNVIKGKEELWKYSNILNERKLKRHLNICLTPDRVLYWRGKKCYERQN